MDNQILLKSYALIDSEELTIAELPEKIQQKIQMLDEMLEAYENATSETEEFDIKERILACDTGLTSDLSSYVAENKNSPKEKQEESEQFEGGGEVKNEEENQSESPKWRFWMK